MTVRSRHLWGPSAVTQVGAVLYTVPAGRTAVVYDVTVVNDGALATACNLYIGTVATANLVWAFGAVASGAAARIGLTHLVLNPGETLRANTGANGSIRCNGFGSLLLGEPS